MTARSLDPTKGGTYSPRVFEAGAGRIPRCCAVHDDWPVLAQHLLDDFPTVTIREVIRALHKARTIVDTFGLEESDALLVAELMARHRLMVPPTVRPDPRRDLQELD